MPTLLKPVELSDLSRAQGFVNTTRPNGYGYDINADRDVPQPQDTAGAFDAATAALNNLPGLISGIYDRLRQAGRDSDAWLLRDAAERFSNAGAATGVNAFGRAAALTDLQARLRAAANDRDAGLGAQELAQLAKVQEAVANLGVNKASTLFTQGMERARFREQKMSTVRNAVAASNAAKLSAAPSRSAAPMVIRVPTPPRTAGVQSLISNAASSASAAPYNGPMHYWGGKLRPVTDVHPAYAAQQRRLGLDPKALPAGRTGPFTPAPEWGTAPVPIPASEWSKNVRTR